MIFYCIETLAVDQLGGELVIRSPFDWHMRVEHNGNGKANKNYVGDDVGRTHGDELRDALSACCTWVWDDLPVVIERLTFGQRRDDYGDKGSRKEPPDALQPNFMRPLRELIRETLQELADCELGDPQESGVKDPGGQHNLAADFAMLDAVWRESVCDRIVGPPE